MREKRKVNNRGNGSCQVVVPKKVMDHLDIVAGDEVEFIGKPQTDYVLLKKVIQINNKNNQLMNSVKTFYNFIENNKERFTKYCFTKEYNFLTNIVLMLMSDDVDNRIIGFLIKQLELELVAMLSKVVPECEIWIFVKSIFSAYEQLKIEVDKSI